MNWMDVDCSGIPSSSVNSGGSSICCRCSHGSEVSETFRDKEWTFLINKQSVITLYRRQLPFWRVELLEIWALLKSSHHEFLVKSTFKMGRGFCYSFQAFLLKPLHLPPLKQTHLRVARINWWKKVGNKILFWGQTTLSFSTPLVQ